MAIFDVGGVKLLVHRVYEPGTDDLPCENHVAFAVDDLDAAVAALQAGGVTLERPPTTYDWGRSAYVRAPSGQLIELEAAPAGGQRAGDSSTT